MQRIMEQFQELFPLIQAHDEELNCKKLRRENLRINAA